MGVHTKYLTLERGQGRSKKKKLPPDNAQQELKGQSMSGGSLATLLKENRRKSITISGENFTSKKNYDMIANPLSQRENYIRHIYTYNKQQQNRIQVISYGNEQISVLLLPPTIYSKTDDVKLPPPQGDIQEAAALDRRRILAASYIICHPRHPLNSCT